MYNGIGLATPRGSGTSGYIQKNLSYLKPRRSDFPSASQAFAGNDFSSFESRAPKVKRANAELLEHEKKRKVEVQLIILEDELKARGLDENEIEQEIKLERQRLLDIASFEDETVCVRNKEDREMIERFDTHQLAQLKMQQNERFRAALELDKDKEKKPQRPKVGAGGDLRRVRDRSESPVARHKKEDKVKDQKKEDEKRRERRKLEDKRKRRKEEDKRKQRKEDDKTRKHRRRSPSSSSSSSSSQSSSRSSPSSLSRSRSPERKRRRGSDKHRYN